MGNLYTAHVLSVSRLRKLTRCPINTSWLGTYVCPITKPTDQRLNMGFVKAWLPEGIYIDFFTGRIYEGGRKIRLFRDITTIPVLAKAGAIIPMAAPGSIRNSTDNPESLEIRVFAGNDGMFTLYEDNSLNETLDNLREAFTKMEFRWGGTAEFTIDAVSGDHGVVPENVTISLNSLDLTILTIFRSAQKMKNTI